LGGRFDARTARGDVPFYQLPYLDLRGIPAARYQGENTLVAELELRYNVNPRWALIGFTGAGRAWGQQTSFDDAGTIVNKGFGFRYLIARTLGLYTGVDFAWGPDQFAFYIQVGSAWR
jgi:outer membrane translocation and assembly module TamA